ncbi:hypothetical protein Anapl_00669 [Anas platyrhynchos]|uniref:Uncharacterized protein n=1 Tax=Anas platyrhynchos TaxID=8839 RepID=R0K122_ANAPL|nr:hypothetical protein Anapl_00669 [Anas platyrhynchos]
MAPPLLIQRHRSAFQSYQQVTSLFQQESCVAHSPHTALALRCHEHPCSWALNWARKIVAIAVTFSGDVCVKV